MKLEQNIKITLGLYVIRITPRKNSTRGGGKNGFFKQMTPVVLFFKMNILGYFETMFLFFFR